MVKIKLLYTYRNKKNGNIIRIASELKSPDWELVKDHEKETNTTQTETDQDAPEEVAQATPEESKETDTAPDEKMAAASAAVKKKTQAAAKKSTGKKV